MGSKTRRRTPRPERATCARCTHTARHLVEAGVATTSGHRCELVCDHCLPRSRRWAAASGPVVVTDLDQLSLFDLPAPEVKR